MIIIIATLLTPEFWLSLLIISNSLPTHYYNYILSILGGVLIVTNLTSIGISSKLKLERIDEEIKELLETSIVANVLFYSIFVFILHQRGINISNSVYGLWITYRSLAIYRSLFYLNLIRRGKRKWYM